MLFKDVKPILMKAAEKDYLNGGKSFENTYQDMLLESFSEKVVDKNARWGIVPVYALAEPSKDQLRYAIKLLKKGNKKRITSSDRLTNNSAKKELRIGTSRDQVPGPGYLYEIDSTILQIYLVSRFGRGRIVGQPTLYFVVDVWSGCIVGFALSLKKPSVELACSALLSCYRSKGGLLKELGLPYTADDWPCNHLPSILRADRGELVSDKAEIIARMGIEIAISPAMSPSSKGTIEGKFSELKNMDRFELLPGRHIKFQKRRDPDGRLTAAVNVIECTQIVTLLILELNNRPPDFVPLDFNFEINDKLTRSDLYKWGIENRAGYTQDRPLAWAVRNLMATDSATVTPRGIKFRKTTYKSDRLRELGYFEKARKEGTFEIQVYYEENRGWEIHTFSEDDELIRAINKREDLAENHVAFFELENFREDKKEIDEATRREVHLNNYQGRKIIEAICTEAVKEAKEAKVGSSKTQKRGNIRKHRKEELKDREEHNGKTLSNDSESQLSDDVDAEANLALKIFKDSHSQNCNPP